ncbi:hypothetical protein AVEN_266244-1 [Araneus ventricosus]|uniref:Uncharacterized protein n=1 Tax=Araneus ventricosus TaxID=182803 RepID=A0A4Y2R3A3_ARAVE|nr:hypothetical protein AVEN_266244-1 [Araneus ventricosus]
MDSPTNAETETPEGSSAMMDCTAMDDSTTCARLRRLTSDMNEVATRIKVASEMLAEQEHGSPGWVAMSNGVAVYQQNLDYLKQQVSDIGSCPVVNCTVHCKNIDRVNLKRPLTSDMVEFPDLDKANRLNRKNNDGYSFPSKRQTARFSVVSNDPENLNDKIAIGNKYATLNSEVTDDGESSQTQPPIRKPPPYNA